MGKLVVLLDLGMRKTCSKSGHAWSSTTTLLILLLLMAICCVGNHGSEVRGGTYKEVVATHPVASPLKQSGEDGVSVGIVNGGKPGIESYGNVTVLAGQRGELKCRTFNLANYTVLWLRHRDTHLLSAGSETYTAESRFRPFQHMYTWGLRISDSRPVDGGIYECQISTTPPISAFTYLNVVEPVTHIEGLNGRGSELFLKAGSTINLTCIVEDATDNAPKHILWKHNSRIVNFEWNRGGMSLITEKKSRGVTVSRLLIQKAARTDSGTYFCLPQNAHPASVKIHVLIQGEKQAAMHSASSTSKRAYVITMALLLHFLLANAFHHQVFAHLSPRLTRTATDAPSTTTSTQQSNLQELSRERQPMSKSCRAGRREMLAHQKLSARAEPCL